MDHILHLPQDVTPGSGTELPVTSIRSGEYAVDTVFPLTCTSQTLRDMMQFANDEAPQKSNL